MKETLGDIVTAKSCYEKAQGQQKAEGYIKLERGFATILPGINVPFHSHSTSGLVSCPSMLVSQHHSFKSFVSDSMLTDLSKKIDPTHLNPDMLVGKYLPNLIAKPF